ncbi:MAG: hypothetical protein LBS99_06815 [Clostridiales bacterium]|nr:hypothetical protein [Clostridiales bacterium]
MKCRVCGFSADGMESVFCPMCGSKINIPIKEELTVDDTPAEPAGFAAPIHSWGDGNTVAPAEPAQPSPAQSAPFPPVYTQYGSTPIQNNPQDGYQGGDNPVNNPQNGYQNYNSPVNNPQGGYNNYAGASNPNGYGNYGVPQGFQNYPAPQETYKAIPAPREVRKTNPVPLILGLLGIIFDLIAVVNLFSMLVTSVSSYVSPESFFVWPAATLALGIAALVTGIVGVRKKNRLSVPGIVLGSITIASIIVFFISIGMIIMSLVSLLS